LPIQAALERVPANLVEASSDLGASPGQTFRNILLPLALPGVVAGSIFTFSLTLGDYIIPQIIGTSRLFIGMAVYAQQGTAGNIPLAAAFTVVPIVSMGFYLWGAKRLGAFDALCPFPICAPGSEYRRRLRPCFPSPADLADLLLRLHYRGKDLPVAAAGAHASMVRHNLEPAGRVAG